MNWKLYLRLAVVGTVFGGLCGWFAARAPDANDPMPPLQSSSFVGVSGYAWDNGSAPLRVTYTPATPLPMTIGSLCGPLSPGKFCHKDGVLNVVGVYNDDTPQVMLVSTPSPTPSPTPSLTGTPLPVTVAPALVRAEAYGRDANGDDRFLRVDASGRVECAK